MFGLLTRVSLIASVMGLIACPNTNTTSSCAVQCSNPPCSGSLNCTTNAACSVNCNGTRACSQISVAGLSQNATTDYAVQCQGSYDCENAVFTTKSVGTTRFLCAGNFSCANTTFNCNSDSCELVCDKNVNSCRDVAFNCIGGAGKTCNVACNGGCYASLNVGCDNYPCSLTFSGTTLGGAVNPCAAGLLLCADGSCIAAGATCPSQCINGDPCNRAYGNKCTDIGIVGNKYNCTCNGAYKAAPMVDGLVPSCDVPLGYGKSLTITTYSTLDCKATSVRTKFTYNAGCQTNPAAFGQMIFTRCTERNYCQQSSAGTCSSSTTCIPSKLEGLCVRGVKAVCNDISKNGAGTISVGVAMGTMFLALLF